MKDKKYKLTNEKKEVFGRTLYRIEAIRNFGIIEKGELGGFIEKEENLSHYRNAWVYGDAKVYGYAEVYGDAEVCGDAEVYGYAEVYGDAEVYEKARVYEKAKVCGDARVCGDAKVCGDARVYGDAELFGNATIKEQQKITTGFITKPLEGKYSFMAQIGFYPTDEFILYKRVNKVSEGKYSSGYDKNFIYKDGKIVEVKNPDMSNKSCSKGIHLSNPLYWEQGDTIIACQVKWKDVITIQEGKVRVKKCYVIGEVNDF